MPHHWTGQKEWIEPKILALHRLDQRDHNVSMTEGERLKRGARGMKGDVIRYDSAEWAGVTIPYSWCHSRRRTLGITVRPDGSVSVRVPLRTSLAATRAFVTARWEWVVKVWKKMSAQPAPQLQEFGRGALFMFQGERFRLEFSMGPAPALHLHDGLLILTVPDIPPEETVRRIIDGWYREQAARIFRERSVECHRMMLEERIPLPRITIRSMKTRWGSYSYRTRRISLNINLIKMPQTCLDYVIIHELCHIKVRHHGSDFWSMVSRFVPDYRDVHRQLKQ